MSSPEARKKRRKTQTIFTYGTLGVLIAALALYLILRNTDRIQYRLPDVAVIIPSDYDAIRVSSQTNGTIDIVRREGSWMIGPEGYGIDPVFMNDIIEAIEGFTLAELVSTTEYYERFDLDTVSRYEVAVLNKGNEVFRFDVGKRSPSYNHTYVRIEDDERVFQAEGNLQSVFSKDVAGLRDKLVFSIDPEMVIRIGVNTPERSFRLYRSLKDDQTVWNSSDEETWDPEAIENVLGQLSNLKCQEFLEDRDLIEPSLVLEIQGEESHQFYLFDQSGSSYLARSSQTPYAFTISSFVAEQLIETFARISNDE